ncbi:MAG: alpha/beta hydrolase [Planctomycetota bacterium]
MTNEILDCVETSPNGPADAAVIWLHGLGADGYDFVPIIPELALPDSLAIRFVFPHAPSIPVTLNGGIVMPAWYDIAEVDLRRRHDEDGIRRSAAQVCALIAREIDRGVPASRIVLAGFSQGGAIAVFAGLRFHAPLAGILALSTYLVCEDSLDRERSDENRATPIFIGHGTFDPMVQLPRGEALRDALVARGQPVEFHTYPMPHSVHPQEIADVANFLCRALA